MVWNSNSEDSNEPILFSSDEISLDDIDEGLQEEYYQDTDPASTENWVRETSGSTSGEESLNWWDEPVEGEENKLTKCSTSPFPI